MFRDIVFPKNNEDKFVDFADKLGIKALCFVYDFSSFDIKKFNKFKDNALKNSKIHIFLGLRIKDLTKARKAKKIADIVLTNNRERKFFERKEMDIIYDLECSELSDPIHYRESGLNQVLCKLLKEKKISLGIAFSTLLNDDKNRVKFLGRIMQNIKLIRKYKINSIIASFANDPYEMRTAKDLCTFFTVLGMHPKEAKDSCTNMYNKIQNNIHRKSNPQDYI